MEQSASDTPLREICSHADPAAWDAMILMGITADRREPDKTFGAKLDPAGQ
jgi:hypothetical protein